jgi:hypothetical protein
MKDAFEALLKRPSITAVDADYESMFQTIRERLTAEVGVAAWVPDQEPMRGSACGDGLSNLDGAEEHSYGAGVSPGNIPDDRWDQAVTIVTEVARQHGFGAPRVVIEGPGSHEVSFNDTFNGELIFGTGGNTVLGGFSGCHLTEEAHQRGTYLPPKKY